MAESSSDSWNRKFYTDLNDMRIEFGLPPKKYHIDLLEDEVFTRTIFIKIHNGIYAISGKELNQVFSTFGTLDTVEVFRHGHGFHSKVCFVSKESTIRAFDSLNGRDIYDNCCRLELFLVQESVKEHKNVDRGTIEMESLGCQMETERQFYEVDKGRNVLQVQYAVAKDDSMNRKIDDDALFFDETVKAASDNKLITKDYDRIFRPDATPAVIDATWSHDVPKSASFPIDLEAAYVKEREPTPICEIDDLRKSKMKALEVLDFDCNDLKEHELHMSSDKNSESLDEDKESIEESTREFIPNYGLHVDISFASRATTAAYQMLEKMPKNEVALVGSSFHYSLRSIDSPSLFAFDPGKGKEFSICTGWVETLLALVFDPGGGLACWVVEHLIHVWLQDCLRMIMAGTSLLGGLLLLHFWCTSLCCVLLRVGRHGCL